MARTDGTLTRCDLQLLHEALSYMRKRVFDQAELVRLKGVIDQLEDLLLDKDGEPLLRLSPPEQDVLERQVEGYCAELTGKYASRDGRQQASRLRGLVERLGGRRRKNWVRRLLGF